MENQSGAGGSLTRQQLTRGTLIAAALAVCVGQMGVAIPAVLNGLFQADLHTSSTQLTWISDAFLVPVTLFELTFGAIGDLFGRKRLLIIGGLLVVLGEGLAVLTPGSSASTDTRVLVLWSGQIIAGIGVACMFPTALAMIAAGTHTAEERGRGIAIWAAALGTGAALSPFLGGLVVRLSWGSDPHASWRWAFVVMVAFAAVSTIVSVLLAEDSSAPEGRSLDWPGQITVALALFALLFAIIEAPTSGWGSTKVIAGFVIAVIAFIAFIAVERRAAAPLLRLELFSSRKFSMVAVITVVGMFAALGIAYSTSVRLAAIQGFSPLKTSVAFVLLNGLSLLQVPLLIRVLPRWNPRVILCTGFGLIAIGAFWMSRTTAFDMSLAPIIAPLIIIGVGIAFAVSGVTAVAVNAVPVRMAGMASGTTNMLRDFGFTLGPALIGAVALSHAASSIARQVTASPALTAALKAFYAAPAHVPAAQQATVGAAVAAVKSGPLGAVGVPAKVAGPHGHLIPFNPVHDVAFAALNHSYQLGYAICAGAALAAFLLAAVGLSRLDHAEEPIEQLSEEGRATDMPADVESLALS